MATLFDTLYEGLEATVKKIKKPLAEKAARRKFDAFIDGCEAKTDELNLEQHELRAEGVADVEKLDVQRLAEIQVELKDVQSLQSAAENEKQELFKTIK